MSFELLSEPIRRYIRDQRWKELRPIQNAAIFKILTTHENYILAARTASGKTEAAFLPILSAVNFEEPGVQVLYISPLKALINDQFTRVEELCKYLDVVITKWHGETNRSAKDHLLKNPNGVVLITPESIEAMFVNKPYNVKHLFSNLKFVVIDEVHSFISTDRGIHLKALLSRLQSINSIPFRIMGLSATIGDYAEAKRFTGNESATKVLLDKTAKNVDTRFRFFLGEGSELPVELMNDLYKQIADHKVLIFPNSRGRTEEIAVKLKKIADRVGGHPNYFSHHSSVDKDVREYVEFFAKTNRRENFAIACTSTLELGIDIGTVDEVVQVDATNSVTSLIQRLGRSGRQDGKKSKLSVYTTDKWSLLQSLACWVLHEQGIIEPPESIETPYDILLHQTLSIVKASSGIFKQDLISQLQSNFAFIGFARSAVEDIVEHLIATDMLEQLRRELILGIEGEKIVNSREFYSVFQTELNLKVVCSGRPIGDLPFSPQIIEGSNIFLAARIWTITYIDLKARTIEVVRALDGKKPVFSGQGANVHTVVREKMFSILLSSENFNVLDDKSSDQINAIRKEFSCFNISGIGYERPLLVKEGSIELFTFTSTKINRALRLLLDLSHIPTKVEEKSSSFEIQMSEKDFRIKWNSLIKPSNEINDYLGWLLSTNPSLSSFTKWSSFLPLSMQIQLLKIRYYDFVGAEHLLRSCHLVSSSGS